MLRLSAAVGSASLAAIAIASLASPAAAQQAAGTAQQEPALPVSPAEDDQQAQSADSPPASEIVVTGTRLARDPNATAPSPITTVSAGDIRASGEADITEVLREVPALAASSTLADSLERGPTAAAGGTAGQATLNLRGLGSNRTLVLVNGRRHVAGVAGTQTVDIATIPTALIETVDVLTGGASAIYGADAVTGVVNFNLRRNFEGIEFGGNVGISDEGDAANYRLEGIYGLNFAEGRGNVVIAGSFARLEELKTGARSFTRDNAQATSGLTYQNPARRFQVGDITDATPNFAQRFNRGAGRFPVGFTIPTAAQFATFFPGRTPTPAEQALIDRAATAKPLVLPSFPTFAISSGAGQIYRADFRAFALDVNGNGIPDCQESFIGVTQGGCYVTEPGGVVRPFRDGIVSTGLNQIGGDGTPETINQVSLIPQSERYDVNLIGRFEFSPAFEVFGEAKYVRSDTFAQPGAPNSFYDLLLIRPDNPFIPQVLRGQATAGGGLRVSRDFFDIPSLSSSDRDTYRGVLGLRGEIAPTLRYEVYANYGRTDNSTTSLSVLPDRLFAAIDVVAGPNGQPTCASNIDPTRRHPGSQFFPVITPGFFTFTPGANSGCTPINLFNGMFSLTPEQVDFVTEPTTTDVRLEQLVVSAQLTGDTASFFNLPGGALQFAIGAEYREEKSNTRFDPLVLGLLPQGSPAGPAGTFVGDIDPRKQRLTFDTTTRVFNTGGRFDVKEVFGELSVPILRQQFFHELTVGGAARYSEYSTIGDAFTWNVNGTFAPIRDLRLRGTYAVAIRAPNVTELFSPQQGTVFRPVDPCDVNVIAGLLASSDPAVRGRAQRRQSNCAAAGAPPGFTDPLTARFSGTAGGNPNLQEETAKTITAGAVLQPRFLPGLTISGDYYDIRIRDAIARVSAQDIVNSCYESTQFPNQFCDLFTRGPNFGFTFLRQTDLNFGRFETAGVDANVSYNFRLADYRIALRAAGNWTEKVDLFFNPQDPTFVNPELGEVGFPEWSGSGSVSVGSGPFTATYRMQYLSRMTLLNVERERVLEEFGDPEGFGREMFIHDASVSFDVGREFTMFGGVNNFTDERPYRNALAYPVSPVGRSFFLGVRARY